MVNKLTLVARYVKFNASQKKFNPWLTLTGVRATETNPRLTFNHWLGGFNHWLTVNHLSSNRGQIVTCSNRAGSVNLFSCSTRFQTMDANLLFDVARYRFYGRFKLKT